MEALHHAWLNSPLGTLQLQSNGNAITGLSFTDAGFRPDVHSRRPADLILQEGLRELKAFFEGRLQRFEVPHEQEGTAFRQRVWAELCTISFGSTCSYRDLARRLGDELVIRAAASANGKNNIAIIVPCHRVIGSNGSLTGYAGGLWRKQWLLEHEQKVLHGIRTLF